MLLIQVYKALNGLAPEFIADLLQAYVPTRALRSAGAKHNHSVGARAFMEQYALNHKNVASLASFRIGLTTYLFTQRF